MIGSKLQHFLLKHCIRRLVIKKVYFDISHSQKEKQQPIDPKVQTFQKLHGISDDKFAKFCEIVIASHIWNMASSIVEKK